MGRKKKIQKCRRYAITKEELDSLINNVEESKHKLMLILLGWGMREGEVAHARPEWVHVEDKRSQQAGADFIDIPQASIECICPDCLLQEYIERKQGDEKHPAEWYKKIQKRFYRLSKKKRAKYVHYWSPKTEAGARKIWILDKAHAKFVKEFYQEHESIEMKRRTIYAAVRRFGKKLLGKKLFPHAVRASTATILANSGINSAALKTQMGWSTLALAERYVKSDETAALRELKRVTIRE